MTALEHQIRRQILTKLMDYYSNLPNGVRSQDVDGSDECKVCDGAGVVDNPDYPEGSDKPEITCEECSGLGVKNCR